MRHVGDFGNFDVRPDGSIETRHEDYLAQLSGPESIIGRGIVVRIIKLLFFFLDHI